MIHGKPLVHRPERVGHRVRDVVLLEPGRQLVNVAPQRLNLRVLRLGDTPGEQVNLHIILGEKGRDFLADERPRLARDLEAALNRVVVGEGDKIKPSLTQLAVERFRIGTTRGKIDLPQQPVARPGAVPRVEMEIGEGHEATTLDVTSAYFTSGIAGNFRTRQTQRTTITSAAIPPKSPKRSGYPGKGTNVP